MSLERQQQPARGRRDDLGIWGFAISRTLVQGVLIVALSFGGPTKANCDSKQAESSCETPWNMCDDKLMIWSIVTAVCESVLPCCVWPAVWYLHRQSAAATTSPHKDDTLVVLAALLVSQVFTVAGVILLCFRDEVCYASDVKPFNFVACIVAMRLASDLIVFVWMMRRRQCGEYFRPDPAAVDRTDHFVAPKCACCSQPFLDGQPVSTFRGCQHKVHGTCASLLLQRAGSCPTCAATLEFV